LRPFTLIVNVERCERFPVIFIPILLLIRGAGFCSLTCGAWSGAVGVLDLCAPWGSRSYGAAHREGGYHSPPLSEEAGIHAL
jgi:hypothetical protein